MKISGDVLLSHAVAHAVPSTLWGLTAVFGMGTGVAPTPWSPERGLAIRTEAKQKVSGATARRAEALWNGPRGLEASRGKEEKPLSLTTD